MSLKLHPQQYPQQPIVAGQIKRHWDGKGNKINYRKSETEFGWQIIKGEERDKQQMATGPW
jgi:hypothetical protein